MRRIDQRTLSLYLVTDRKLSGNRPLEQIVEEAVKGGVTIVQLREKDLDRNDFIREGQILKRLLKPYHVPLIINDNVEVAAACDADGVHIGQSDISAAEARRILGPDKIIGLSVENFDQVQQAQTFDIDYIAASPVYSTSTKKNTRTEFLPEGVKKMVRMSSMPVVGIGRMNIRTAGEVIMAGAEGVAVVSAIMGAADPRNAAEKLAEAVNSAKMERELETGNHVRWSRLAHIAAKDILMRVKREHFFQEMRSGKLKYHRFNSFMIQNELIFRQYTQLLRYMEIRTESDMNVLPVIHHFLKETASDTSAMHSFYLGDFPELKTANTPSCYSEMVDFLKNEVRESPIHIAMAAMLAFPFLLSELGRYFILHSNNESNRYITWVNLYGSQEFTHDIEKFTDVVDSLANNVGTYQKVLMLKSFRHCSNYFLALWKSQI